MRNTLRQLREAAGLTQADLAARVAVSRQTIISVEQGRYDPSLKLAFALADVFRVTIESIFDPDYTPAHWHNDNGISDREQEQQP